MGKPLSWAVSLLMSAIAGVGVSVPCLAGPPIAGLEPYQRPSGAPVIESVVKPPGWYTQALTGISPPYPSSLRFLEDQGNWHTPFIHPGMGAPYDLRGWHAR